MTQPTVPPQGHGVVNDSINQAAEHGRREAQVSGRDNTVDGLGKLDAALVEVIRAQVGGLPTEDRVFELIAEYVTQNPQLVVHEHRHVHVTEQHTHPEYAPREHPHTEFALAGHVHYDVPDHTHWYPRLLLSSFVGALIGLLVGLVVMLLVLVNANQDTVLFVDAQRHAIVLGSAIDNPWIESIILGLGLFMFMVVGGLIGAGVRYLLDWHHHGQVAR